MLNEVIEQVKKSGSASTSRKGGHMTFGVDTLPVLPKDAGPDGPAKLVNITRNTIQLEDQAARKKLLKVEGPQGPIRLALLGADDRPWILLRPNGVSIARMEPIREAHDIERIVRAGVDLAGGFTFGRR